MENGKTIANIALQELMRLIEDEIEFITEISHEHLNTLELRLNRLMIGCRTRAEILSDFDLSEVSFLDVDIVYQARAILSDAACCLEIYLSELKNPNSYLEYLEDTLMKLEVIEGINIY